jgi:2-polyprenyl-3-methyl-5-hydroxy-6-metoxy-1,4-benzoquinol methylase
MMSIRSFIYDRIVVDKYTEYMNKHFLEAIEDGASILDIGVGTGYSMIKNTDLIKNKDVKIDGIDIDEDYCAACQMNINGANLQNNMTVNKINIYSYNTEKKYDYVLFSDSYAVIPDVHTMIEHCKSYLKPTGKIIILTTLDDEVTLTKLLVKPRLVYFTLCDFGKVTTKAEFVYNIEHENNLNIDDIKCIYSRSVPFYGEIKSYMTKLSVTSVKR